MLCAFFQRRLEDDRPKKFLHVAPEQCLEARLQRRFGSAYVSADLVDPGSDLIMDLTAIDEPDGRFDAICCCHVLEHIDDDRRAMQELRRVLAAEGWMVVQVPVIAEKTWQDPAIQTPEERQAAYRHWDHRRAYGPDVADRLREAGFDVEVVDIASLVPDESETRRMGLTSSAGDIYFCRPKPSETDLASGDPG